jgi:hypothetical protein
LLAKRERNQWLHVKDRELEERRRPTLHLRNPTILQLRPGSRIQEVVVVVLAILDKPDSASMLAWRWDLHRSIPMRIGQFLTRLIKPAGGGASEWKPVEKGGRDGSVWCLRVHKASGLAMSPPNQ